MRGGRLEDVSPKAGLFSSGLSESSAWLWVEGGLGEEEKLKQSRVTSVLFRLICGDDRSAHPGRGPEGNWRCLCLTWSQVNMASILSESYAVSPSCITEGRDCLPADRRVTCNQVCQAELCRAWSVVVADGGCLDSVLQPPGP